MRLTYRSPDGEEGFPGNLDVAITYTVTPDDSFVIESEVSTDRATPVNLTHHSYFNLAGESAGPDRRSRPADQFRRVHCCR